MMKFSQMAAKYFQDVEVIELHHDQKLDAPSGTAVKTVELIRQNRESKQQGHPNEVEQLAGARGANVDGIHIHSVRLPGLIAHQEVMFGGDGQMLTVRHDSFNRASFMSGVKLSIETVMNLDHLVYGLEKYYRLKGRQRMKIALIAHDKKKNDMVSFAYAYKPILNNMNYLQQERQGFALWKRLD